MGGLSPRLKTIAGLVKYDTLADVASDHALLPIHLAAAGALRFAVASDISRACFEKARAAIKAGGLEGVVEARVGDGLSTVAVGECGALVIAGVGGMLIVEMLGTDLAKAQSFGQILLSPHRDAGAVRAFLIDNGFAINGEAALFDGGNYYVVIDCAVGLDTPYTEEELAFGRHLLRSGDAATRKYIESEMDRARRAVAAAGDKAVSAKRYAALCEKALMFM